MKKPIPVVFVTQKDIVDFGGPAFMAHNIVLEHDRSFLTRDFLLVAEETPFRVIDLSKKIDDE